MADAVENEIIAVTEKEAGSLEPDTVIQAETTLTLT